MNKIVKSILKSRFRSLLFQRQKLLSDISTIDKEKKDLETEVEQIESELDSISEDIPGIEEDLFQENKDTRLKYTTRYKTQTTC